MLYLLLATGAAAAGDVPVRDDDPVQTPRVEVVATAPVGRSEHTDRLPFAAQSTTRADLDRAGEATLLAHLRSRFAGVVVNDIQGSTFQGDFSYRGYRASGLLGAPQGLSVYLDGVRLNEPFGDVVHWELLPEFVLEQVQLVPAATPAFGLNSLGGALVLRSLDGADLEGTRMRLRTGSDALLAADVATGVSGAGGWHALLSASHLREQGWRHASPGELGRVLLKAGRESAGQGWSVSLLLGDSELVGNGLVPAYTLQDRPGGLARIPDLHARDRRAVFTHPDASHNRSATASWRGHRTLAAGTLRLLAWHRRGDREGVNGDDADQGDDADDDAQPSWPAALNRSSLRQRSSGGTTVLSGDHGRHAWQLGADASRSRVRYLQSRQAGVFTADRRVLPAPGSAVLTSAVLDGSATAAGVHVQDTVSLGPRAWLTVALRHDRSRVRNALASLDEDAGVLRARAPERFDYRSTKPAIGLVWSATSQLQLFASAARNTRVPTAIELGCADPAAPCRLPAGLQSDPFLAQVVSRTFEAGARGQGDRLDWSVSAYRTDNRDDILFRSVDTVSQLGYFQNFPRTRHQGVDLVVETTLGADGATRLRLAASLLRATYQAHGLLRRGGGNVPVVPGTRMAGLPARFARLQLEHRLSAALHIGLGIDAQSGRGTAGNEHGRYQDRPADLGTAGFATVDVTLRYAPPASPWAVALRVGNVFDRRFVTFATLGGTVFDAHGRYTGDEADAVFVGPGAPRHVLLTVSAAF